jgi:transposase
MLKVGLDLHQRTSTCHILDARGRCVKRKTITGHWSKMLRELERMKEPMEVCYEASCGYGVVHDRLQRLARRIVVAHPGHLRLIFKGRCKNDRIDAEKLAKLLYLDEVPAVHVPDLQVRAWRELIETRRRQVDARVRIKNQIRALLRGYGKTVPRDIGGLWTVKGRAWLAEENWPTPIVALRRDVLLRQLQHGDEMIRILTKQLDEMAGRHSDVILLRTIPGVGPRTAEAFVAYVDDPQRFERTNQVASYFGLVPREDSSAGVHRMGHITKSGPATARKLLTEAAWRCIDKNRTLRAVFDRIAMGKKDRRRIAIIAIARRLTRIMLAMLKSGQSWSEAQWQRHLSARVA